MRMHLPLLVVLATVSAVFAQNDIQPIDPATISGRGPETFHNGRITESIDPYSGNLHVELPLVTLKGRAHDSRLRLIYNSHFWVGKYNAISDSYVPVCDTELSQNPSLGWALTSAEHGGRITNSYIRVYATDTSGNPPVTHYHEYINFTDIENNKVALTGINDEASNTGTTNSIYRSSGSEFMEADQSSSGIGTFDVRFKDGTVVLWAGHTLDTNGNYLDSDTLGRAFTYASQPDGSETISYTTDSGGTAVITLRFTTYTVNCYGTSLHNSDTRPLLSSVALPNGETYTFQYAYTNELSKIGFPGGGYVRYEYDLAGTHSSDTNASRGTVSKRALSADGVTESAWNYNYVGPTTITRPDNTQQVVTFNAGVGMDRASLPTKIQYKNASGNILRTIDNSYIYDNSCPPSYAYCFNNPKLQTSKTTLETNQQAQTVFGYDSYGNVTSAAEYDYGSGAPGAKIRSRTYSYLSTSPYINAHILNRPTSQYVYDAAASKVAQTQIDYDNTTISGTSSAPAHDYTRFPATNAVRGNPTRIRQWLNTTNAFLPDHVSYYNDLGGLTKETDSNGNSTTYDYTDRWNDSYCAPASNGFAFVTTTTNALSQQYKATYFPCSGLPEPSQNPNDIANSRPGTTFSYDVLGRPLAVNYPDSGATTYAYNDTAPPLSVTTHVKRNSAGATIDSTVLLDGIGRQSQTQLTSDPDGLTKTDITYDVLGRTLTASNPYRSTSDPTYGAITRGYDALGRPISLTKQDNSVTQMSYSGNCSTSQDEVGNKRKSCTDSLGRLTAVWEDPNGLNFETDYTYNVLDNLLTVTQKGGSANSADWRSRSFVYDSLSRVTSSSNPESGTVTYQYDADGDVQTKTAPLPNQTGTATVTATYTYDALNRLTKTSYNDGATPTVQLGYDGTSLSGCTIAPPAVSDSNPVGHRTAMCDGSGATAWKHDAIGRVLVESRLIGTVAGSTQYTYNLDGSTSTLKNPIAGDLMTYTEGGAGRSLSMTAPNVNYATAATYASFGALQGLTLGSSSSFAGLTVTNGYNPRMQPVLFSLASPGQTLFSLSYDYHSSSSANNGNVYQVVNNLDGTRTVNYTYDTLNRIKSAATQVATGSNAWGQNFGYYSGSNFVPGIDPWGNLFQVNVSQGTAPSLSLSISGANRVQGYCYDSAGNLLDLGACAAPGSHTYAYNSAGQMVSTAGYSYSYDGDGNRVSKSNASTGTLYWRDLAGKTLVETNTSGAFSNLYAYFNGTLVAHKNATLHFHAYDHLGSLRYETNADGSTCEQDIDYFPFGGEHRICYANAQHFQFTGKERDSESGNDYFGARYYASTTGRFLSPDSAAYSSLTDPQSLNLYSYVGNHPTSMIDPDGHCWEWAQKLCDAARNAGERFDNLFHGEGFHTNRGVEDIAHRHNAQRRQQEVNGEKQFGNPAFNAWAFRMGSRYGTFRRNLDDWWDDKKCAWTIVNCGGLIAGDPFINPSGAPAKVRVGRWMSTEELAKMKESGQVVESRLNGVTSVTVPPNPGAYNDAAPGDVFVEFDVEAGAVRGISSNGWGKIYGPNSIFGDILGIKEMPEAQNIEVAPE